MVRYYNPDTGVFLSLDPVRGDKMNPITMNGYNYANNNPVMNVDSNGEWAQVVWYVSKCVIGGASATWELVLKHYQKNKFKKWNTFNWSKFTKLFLAGGLTHTFGQGITKYMTKNNVEMAGKIAFNVTFAVKEYVLLKVAAGEKITWKGAVASIYQVVLPYGKYIANFRSR